MIKKTGLFNTVDKLYGEPPVEGGADGGDTAGEEPGLDAGSESVADFDMGGSETEAPGGGDEITEPVSAAEGFNKEKGLPLLFEQKGLSLYCLKNVVDRSKNNIDVINEEVDSLLED